MDETLWLEAELQAFTPLQQQLVLLPLDTRVDVHMKTGRIESFFTDVTSHPAVVVLYAKDERGKRQPGKVRVDLNEVVGFTTYPPGMPVTPSAP